jgi:O-antigen/teichoic acid export membrane protein
MSLQIRVAIYSILGIIFNGLSGILAARSLGPLQFAAFASSIAAITVLQVFFQGLQFSAHQEFATEHLSNEAKSVDNNTKSFVKQILSITVILAVIFFGFGHHINLTGFQSLAILLMVFPSVSMASVAGFHLWRKEFDKYQKLATTTAFYRLIITAFVFIFLLRFPQFTGSAPFVLALVMANYSTLIVNKFRLPLSVFMQSKIWGKKSIRYVSIISISWLLIQGDLILINVLMETREAGIVSAYSTVAKIFVSGLGLIGLMYSGRFNGVISIKERIHAVLLLSFLAAVVSIFLILFGGPAFNFLYGKDFGFPVQGMLYIFLANCGWAVFCGILYLRANNNPSRRLAVYLLGLFIATLMLIMTVGLDALFLFQFSTVIALCGILILILT